MILEIPQMLQDLSKMGKCYGENDIGNGQSYAD